MMIAFDASAVIHRVPNTSNGHSGGAAVPTIM